MLAKKKKKKKQGKVLGRGASASGPVLGGEAAPVQALEVTAVFMRQVGKKEETV